MFKSAIISDLPVACEQALRSRMGRKESGKRKVGVGRGKGGGRGRGGEPVDKIL